MKRIEEIKSVILNGGEYNLFFEDIKECEKIAGKINRDYHSSFRGLNANLSTLDFLMEEYFEDIYNFLDEKDNYNDLVDVFHDKVEFKFRDVVYEVLENEYNLFFEEGETPDNSYFVKKYND